MSDKGERCVLGLDFGSDSVRAVVVRVADGEELAAGAAEYLDTAPRRLPGCPGLVHAPCLGVLVISPPLWSEMFVL